MAGDGETNSNVDERLKVKPGRPLIIDIHMHSATSIIHPLAMMPTWGYEVVRITEVLNLTFTSGLKVCHHKMASLYHNNHQYCSCMYTRPSVKPASLLLVPSVNDHHTPKF